MKLLAKKLSKLGHDPLKRDLDCPHFKSMIKKKKKKTIAQVLMNQSVISGIGNYLKAEILYAARVSPHRECDSLTDKELGRICKYTNQIMNTSYNSGGATILTYKDENGNPGTFSRRFMVYNQKKDPLGNDVIRETTKDKRTTHWVPEVQK
jgi:formamidopyrimidine-DNA glycosylase